MNKLWAIAAITVRSAIRSRIFLILGALLVAVVVGLPLTIRGDGTVTGHVQLLLRYSLGASFLLLGVAMLWTGCSAISVEIRDRQMHLVATKPVHPLLIWLGKWLGLLIIQAVLLAFAGGVVYVLLQWTVRPSVLETEERKALHENSLVARQHVFPEVPDVEPAVRAAVQKKIDEGTAGDIPPETLLDQARTIFLQRAFSVPAGGRKEWVFHLPSGHPSERPLYVQFRFEKSVLDLEPVQGRWTFRDSNSASPKTVAGTFRPKARHTLRIPEPIGAGGGKVTVGFENIDPVPALLLFDPADGLVVRLHRGGFAGNYLRALLVLYARLSFLSALGLAAGTLFSLPVAAFTSLSFMLFVVLHDYIHTLADSGRYFSGGPDTGLGWVGIDHVLAMGFRLLATVLRPLRGSNPLDWLAAGRWISGYFVAHEFLVQGLAYGGILALACAFFFRRRELGMPA